MVGEKYPKHGRRDLFVDLRDAPFPCCDPPGSSFAKLMALLESESAASVDCASRSDAAGGSGGTKSTLLRVLERKTRDTLLSKVLHAFSWLILMGTPSQERRNKEATHLHSGDFPRFR